MAHAPDEHPKTLLFDPADQSIVADTATPKLAEPRPAQCLAERARIVQRRQAIVQIFKNALLVRPSQLAELLFGGGAKFQRAMP